jgi:large subunit ribosomal protein L10e
MKASTVKDLKNTPNTRREYMGGVPGSKIKRFTMGSPQKDFDNRLELVSLKDAQIRHQALEAARIAANRILEPNVGLQNYHLRIITYPHHVVREHKRINVAQADRFQEGMRKAFGSPVGMAARVERGDQIIIVEVDENDITTAKTALTRASHKLPISTRTFVKENN